MNKLALKPRGQSSQSDVLKLSDGADRTLYFHTGTHKTGSTALQVYLAVNNELLGNGGVSYAFPAGANQEAGNGQYLFDQIYERNMSDRQLEELLELYLAGRTVAICSSEDFSRFKFQEWRQIQDACHRLQVQVRVVTFIRDIGPYYFSLHGQLIKGGENYSSFEDFCKLDHYFDVLDSLKSLLDVFGRESMSVIHYESAIDHMDTAFMKVVGLPPEDYDSAPLKRTINRSLTEYEQEILTRINEATGRQYSLELSDLLMSQRPDLQPVRYLNRNITEILMKRHSVDVDWINQTFFGGTEVVKIGNDALSNTANNALSAEDRQAIDRDVANWCISKLQSAQDQSTKYVSERLRAIDWENAGNPLVPNDFDPIAYLLLNRDVLMAGVAPHKHFINFGQYENGRIWNWKDL